MADDETIEDTSISEDIEEAATGRRWRLCLVMIGLGIVCVAIGSIFGPWPLIPGGFVLILAFAFIAAGSTGVDVSLGAFRGKAPLPRNTKRRKIVRKVGFPKHGRSPTKRNDSEDPPT